MRKNPLVTLYDIRKLSSAISEASEWRGALPLEERPEFDRHIMSMFDALEHVREDRKLLKQLLKEMTNG